MSGADLRANVDAIAAVGAWCAVLALFAALLISGGRCRCPPAVTAMLPPDQEEALIEATSATRNRGQGGG